MTHTVTVGTFEGPLGILLQLVERGNIEVTEISIAAITAQYLERIHEVPDASPEQLSDFLQLGARLLHIKSLALLPGDTAEERTMEIQRLNDELAEYRRFQFLARELAKQAHRQTWERPVTERLSTTELPLPQITLQQLSAAFTTAIGRLQPAPEPTIIPSHLTLAMAMTKLQRQLPAGFSLNQLLADCQTRLEIIVTFLAVLELARQGLAQVRQSDQFSPITVEAIHA